MRKLMMLLTIVCVLFVGCDDVIITLDPPGLPVPEQPACPPNTPCPYEFLPPVDLPPEMREPNWGGGSCVHASMVSILRWQQLPELAAWWRKTYIGGETLSGLVSKSDKAGLNFAYTGDGDVNVLEWASRTRRGAVIFYKPSHSISFFGFVTKEDGQRYACVMDNNRTQTYEWIPYDRFIQAWKGYGGVALTPVYSPTPPLPWL